MLKVFVYGTLKPGEAYYKEYCEPYVLEAMPALTKGCVFHLPQGYPAMTLGDLLPKTLDNFPLETLHERYVTGALLHLKDEAAIAPMDEFEDYDPTLSEAENLYIRQLRPVFSLDYQPLGSAWMYVMQPERVHQYGGILVPTGNWSREQWHSIAPFSEDPGFL